MERANAILTHPLFIEKLKLVNKLEEGRVFCGHGMEHLLDVARIAHILNLEAGTAAFPRELIYAAALLHDIGRARQYEDGTPHEAESARLAAVILTGCGFDVAESELILDAILAHRTKFSGGRTDFAWLLYRADKLSRRCFECAAMSGCNWELKNIRLEC